MRPLLLLTVVVLGCACAPSSPPSSPPRLALPRPFAEPEVPRAEASLPVCRGEPYTTDRAITLSCCYPDPNRIRHAIAAQHEAFRACYEQVLRRDRDARGSILTRFTIGDDGRVPYLCIEDSEIDDRYFVDCVADAFAAASFPETPDTAGCPVQTVAYSLLFRPVGEG